MPNRKRLSDAEREQRRAEDRRRVQQAAQQLAAFFRAHERHLERTVYARARNLDIETIYDACAIAWLKLVARPDIRLDHDGFAWLATVATREAWRPGRECPELPVGMFTANRDDVRERSDPRGLAGDPLDRVIATELHDDRIALFAELQPSQRRDLLLHAGGYSYREIAAVTGSTYNAVNRRITDGRAQLRRVRPGVRSSGRGLRQA